VAIDTRDKRASALACGLPWLVPLPTPDGTIGAADRAHSAGFYAGIAVGAPAATPFSGSIADPNAFGGTIADPTVYGGSLVDPISYGGSIADPDSQ